MLKIKKKKKGKDLFAVESRCETKHENEIWSIENKDLNKQYSITKEINHYKKTLFWFKRLIYQSEMQGI